MLLISLKGNLKMNDIKVYGCPESLVKKTFEQQYNINMYLAGMLSDAQHAIAAGQDDLARTILNQVKLYFFDYTDCRNQTAIKEVNS